MSQTDATISNPSSMGHVVLRPVSFALVRPSLGVEFSAPAAQRALHQTGELWELAALAFCSIRPQVNLGVRHQPRFGLSINRALILGVVTGAVVACVSKNPSTSDSQSVATSSSKLVVTPIDSASTEYKQAVRLVDFGVHGIMADSVAKVEVTFGTAVDTIPGLFTSLTPIAGNDGTIHGIGMTEGGEARTGYDYDSRTKRLTVFPLPSDVNGFFHEIELSSDAKYVAYVAHVQSGQMWAVVRSWPSMTPVTRTPPSEGYPSDVGYDRVAWLGPDHFRISYRISSGPSIVVEGDPRSGRTRVDTVPTPQK